MADDGHVSVDEYNLPAGILGLHPDGFYGAIGRIVCVSAVLEGRSHRFGTTSPATSKDDLRTNR